MRVEPAAEIPKETAGNPGVSGNCLLWQGSGSRRDQKHPPGPEGEALDGGAAATTLAKGQGQWLLRVKGR